MSNTSVESGDSKPKKRHILRIILVIILVLLLALAGFIWFNANRNVKAMNDAREKVMEAIEVNGFKKTEVDCSEYEDLRVYGIMKFDTEQYDIEGLGNLCVMRANAGVMQMLTVIVTPAEKDMPLMSVDYMYMLGNRTAYVEVYDLNVSDSDARQAVIDRLKGISSEYKNLNDTTPTAAWYDALRTTGSFKKVTSNEDSSITDMLTRYMSEYFSSAGQMEALPTDAVPDKLDVVEGYTHRLISEGGVSTDVFKKKLGEDKTTEFFDTVMFGTGNYS